MLERGATVGGYRVDGVLGQGGMGIVYQATQMSLNRQVALKLLAPHLSTDDAFRERFRREGVVQAEVDHPHIVTVYEAGESDQGLFIAMRMVRGPALKDLILARELDVGRTLRILSPIGDAVDTAHEMGMTHRDIKPQNILVGGRDHAYLADFGLTKGGSGGGHTLTKTGQFVGTIDYIAPEQIQGHASTPASDIYALGAVFFECLTGSVPFVRESEAAVLYAHLSVEPPRVSELRPGLPGRLDEVLTKAMAKDPAARHGTAGELMADAEDAFSGIQAAVTAPGPIKSPEEAGIRAADVAAPAPETAPAPPPETAPAPPPETAPAPPPGAPPAPETVPAPAAETAPAPPAPQPTTPPQTPVTGTPTAPPAQRPPDRPVSHPTAELPDEPSRRRSTAFRRRAALGGLGVLVLLGFLIGALSGGGESVETTNSASRGPLEISFPDTWARSDKPPAIPGMPIREPIYVAPKAKTRAGLEAGLTSASGPALLPASFLRLLPDRTPPSDQVKLGDLEALRYRGLRPKGFGQQLTVYVVPTSAGVATAACIDPGAGGGRAERECAAIASTLEISGVRTFPIGPDSSYAQTLSSTITRLNKRRSAARSDLRRARTPGGQARAARAASRAYRDASRTISGLSAGPAVAEANKELAAALRDVSRAYDRLASAAARGDRGRYRRAARALRQAERDAERALARLEPLGYRVA